MLIEGVRTEDIECFNGGRYTTLKQQDDIVVVDKQQALLLIETLQKWINGEDTE